MLPKSRPRAGGSRKPIRLIDDGGEGPDTPPPPPDKRAEQLVTYPDCDHPAGFDLFENCRMCKRPREVDPGRARV